MKGVKIPSFSVLLIFAVLITVGVALIPSLNLQYMPREKKQTLSIYYYWQNASARVIESEVTSKIEGYISSIKGIEDIASPSRKMPISTPSASRCPRPYGPCTTSCRRK